MLTQSNAAQESWKADLVICSDGGIAQGIEMSPETVVHACANKNGLHNGCDLQRYA